MFTCIFGDNERNLDKVYHLYLSCIAITAPLYITCKIINNDATDSATPQFHRSLVA